MKSPILVIDNYDSFTYNLVHLLKEMDQEVLVWRNDQFELDEVEAFNKILLSPGPGLPKDSGNLMPLIERYHNTKDILGVCLGMQALAEFFGAKLLNLTHPFHGVQSELIVKDQDAPLYKNYPTDAKIGRYHSWVVDPAGFPEDLQITAVDESDWIMGIRHKVHNVRGLQFHPESVLTDFGEVIIKNWTDL